MLEIIAVLVVGSLIYSTFQGVKRGKVTPEERAANPTLIESIATATGELATSMEKARAEQQFMIKYCGWFRRFESIISINLRIAEIHVAHEKEDDALRASSPEDYAFFKASMAKTEAILDAYEASRKQRPDYQLTARDAYSMPDPVWLATGRPKAPAPTTDPDVTEMQNRIFAEQSARHRDFVAQVRGRLRQAAQLKTSFENSIQKQGYADLVRIHFPAEAAQSLGMTEATDVQAYWKKKPLSPALESAYRVLREHQALHGGLTALHAMPPTVSLPAAPAPRPVISFAKIAPPANTGEQVRAAELRTFAETRAIPHLEHFTCCENLLTIQRHGLRSIADCRASGIPALNNDGQRLDNALDGISVSVAFPNYRMFYKYRQLASDADWAVLILSPEILWTKPCGFFRLNAADHRMRDRPRAEMTVPQAFRDMFETPDAARPAWLCPCDPTDSQAEVMVFDRIEPGLIKAVVFKTRTCRDTWAHATGEISTFITDPRKGMFGTREMARM